MCARGKVGSGHDGEHFVYGRVRLTQQEEVRCQHFVWVVAWRVHGETNRHTIRRTVHHSIIEPDRQVHRLRRRLIVVRLELARAALCFHDARQTRVRQAGLRVPRRRRLVTKMQTHTALHVNEGNPHAERLRHRVHGLLHARVAMRVVGEHQASERRCFLVLRGWREAARERCP